MRKTRKERKSTQGRVLARILAEDMRNVRIGGGGASISETFQGGTGNHDFTNVGWDGDKPEI